MSDLTSVALPPKTPSAATPEGVRDARERLANLAQFLRMTAQRATGQGRADALDDAAAIELVLAASASPSRDDERSDR